MYRIYIRPLLEYSAVIWHSSLTSNQAYQLEMVQKRALRIVLGHNYVSYANALGVCDVDQPGGSNIVLSLGIPFPNVTGLIGCTLHTEARYGRQLRNDPELNQPRARTNRYASSPVPYYGELINIKLPSLDFLHSVSLCACLFPSWALSPCTYSFVFSHTVCGFCFSSASWVFGIYCSWWSHKMRFKMLILT